MLVYHAVVEDYKLLHLVINGSVIIKLICQFFVILYYIMELYNKEDVELVNKNIDKFIDEIEDKKLDIFEPGRDEIKLIENIVYDYIRSRKIKVYGGTSQNALVKAKNPADGWYGSNTIPDIDVYSPDPINDAINLCNILHEKKFRNVRSSEAEHIETYKVFVNFREVCDFSYVPRNIYNRIPFIEINGINYVHPSFMMIDLYKMLTDPYFSSFRWKKTFPRIQLIQKHYPFPKPAKSIPNVFTINHKLIDPILKNIDGFIKTRNSLILIGQIGYNYILAESGLHSNKYKYLDVPFYELLSTNYIKDASDIVNDLMTNFPDLASRIKYVEHYPLWLITGYNVTVYIDEQPVAYIYDHNDRCQQVKYVKAKQFKDNKMSIDTNNTVTLASFDLLLLMNMTIAFRMRVNKDGEKLNFYNILTSYLIDIRNTYLDTHNLTLLDDSIFQELIPTCVGSTHDPRREARLRRTEKTRKFRYEPENPKKQEDWQFSNTSGNPVTNIKNLKLAKYIGSYKEEYKGTRDQRQ